MPGPWTPEHRAAYEASIEARRAGLPKPDRRTRRPPNAGRGPRVEPVEARGLVASLSHEQFEQGMAELADLFRGIQRTAVEEHERTRLAVQVAASNATKPVEEVAERMRQTALRVEDKVALIPTTPVEQANGDTFIAAMRAINKRLVAIEAVAAENGAMLKDVLTLLRRLDSRPARVVEFRPSTTRTKDGGTPIRDQRRREGLTKRAPRREAVG